MHEKLPKTVFIVNHRKINLKISLQQVTKYPLSSWDFKADQLDTNSPRDIKLSRCVHEFTLIHEQVFIAMGGFVESVLCY